MRAPFIRGSFRPQPPIGVRERFGIRSLAQLISDYAEIVREGVRGQRFQVNWRSLAILRPELALPAYGGWIPADGLAPIFNLFDRIGGGIRFRQRVSRTTCRDYRGGTLTYDEHDGTDLVCPVGTPLVAAAPVPSPVNPHALEDIASACTDATIRGEIAALAGNRPALAALMEDALVHDAWAFPESMVRVSVRPPGAPAADAVQLTLPLPASDYRGVRLADTPWSASGASQPRRAAHPAQEMGI